MQTVRQLLQFATNYLDPISIREEKMYAKMKL